MRNYSIDSPQAAARIVSMVALADGHLCDRELDRMCELGATSALGLTREQLLRVMQEYYEDMQMYVDCGWTDACRLNPASLDAMLAEVRDPQLRQEVLRLCLAVADADAHGSDSEHRVIDMARSRWPGATATAG
jgi:tellurite resistance protein